MAALVSVGFTAKPLAPASQPGTGQAASWLLSHVAVRLHSESEFLPTLWKALSSARLGHSERPVSCCSPAHRQPLGLKEALCRACHSLHLPATLTSNPLSLYWILSPVYLPEGAFILPCSTFQALHSPPPAHAPIVPQVSHDPALESVCSLEPKVVAFLFPGF